MMTGHLTDQDIATLQEKSLTNADRLEQQYREYLKNHSGTTKDAFLGLLLSGDVDAAQGALAPST